MGKRFGAEGEGFVKPRTPGGIGLEHAFDHDAVQQLKQGCRNAAPRKIRMGIEQGAKAVNEGNRADAGVWTGSWAAQTHALLHRGEEDVQRWNTSRPWLMSSVGSKTEYAGQTTITLTSLHAHFGKARGVLMLVSALLKG